MHAACFSPTISTFIKAIKNNHFTTWSGLDEHLITKHLPTSEAMLKGHLTDERHSLQSTKLRRSPRLKHLQSTQSKQPLKPKPSSTNTSEWKEIDEDFFPIADSPSIKAEQIIYHMHDNTWTRNKGFMDLTGRFPYKLARGYEYLLIAYNYDANAILVQPV